MVSNRDMIILPNINRWKKILFFILLSVSGSFIFAQIPDKDSIVTLSTFEVSANRLDNFSAGQKKQSFDSLTTTLNSQLNLDEILLRNTSLQIKNYNFNGLSTISFRGTGAEHTGVYWNGFALNQSNTGQVDFSLIPSGYFNDINILYGGGSSLYGSGNIGGSIHLNSKPTFKKQMTGVLGISAGSFEEFTGYGSFIVSDANWYSKTQLTGKISKNNFEFTNLYGEKEKQKNAVTKQYGFMQDIYRNFGGKYVLGGSFWYQNNYRQIPASLTTKPSDVNQTDESARAMISVQRFFKKSKFTFRSAYFHDYFFYHDPEKISSNIIDSKITTNKFNTEIQYDHRFSENSQLSTGISLINEQGNSINWNGDVNQRTMGLFALWSQYLPVLNWTVNVNLRQNFTDGYHVPFTPLVGLEGKIWRFISGKISLSKNYRIPTFNERFWIPGGNENLKPENSWNQEASILFKPVKTYNKLYGDLIFTAFNSCVDDWIVWIPVGQYVTPENIKNVWSRGLEISGTGKYKWSNFNLGLNGGYTYALSTNQSKISGIDEAYQKQLIYVPKHRYYLNFSMQYKTYLMSYNHHYTGKRFVSSDNSEFLPAYSLGNITFRKDFNIEKKGLYIQFEILNLWNTEYQSIPFYPMPGRHYKLSINTQI